MKEVRGHERLKGSLWFIISPLKRRWGVDGQQRTPRGPLVGGVVGLSFLDLPLQLRAAGDFFLLTGKAIQMIYGSLGSLTVQLFKFLRTVFTPNLSLKSCLVDQLPPASLNNGGPLFSTPHPR